MTRFRRVIHVFLSRDYALEYACEMTCGVGAVTKAGSDRRRKPQRSVWQALAKDEAEAEILRLRADLLIALRDRVAAWNLTQAEAAKRLGISQPRLNNMLRGQIESFSLDMPTKLACRAGLRVEIRLKKAA